MGIREVLYRIYIAELAEYDAELASYSYGEIESWIVDYMVDPLSEWVDVYSADGQIVGFVIFSHNGSNFCHPDTEHYICQTYIRKEYRDRGLVSRAIKRYFDNHTGRYGLSIIDNNEPAKEFWEHIFSNYPEIELEEVRKPEDCKHLILKGYMVF